MKKLFITSICFLFVMTVFGQTELIVNGNFSGSGGWVASGDFHFGTTYSSCPCGTPPCYGYGYLSTASGNAGNNLGGDLEQFITLQQTYSSATFTFCYNATSNETSPNQDYLQAVIMNNNSFYYVTAYVTSIVGNVPGTTITYTLTDPALLQAGVTLDVFFEGSTNATLPTTMRVDNVSLIAYAVPPAPTGLVATAASSSSINLTWNASSGAASYDVYTCSGSFVSNTSSSFYTVTGLLPNTYYNYKVRAVTGNGNSSFTACAGTTTLPGGSAPPVPTGLTATSTSSSSVSLSWNSSSGALNYDVYTCSGSFVTNTTNTNFTVTGLMPNTYYDYKVKAINNYGSSSFCVCAGATTQSAGSPPPVPTGLTASALSSSSVYLTWNTSTGAASYDVYTCSGSFVANTTNTNYTVTGLMPNTYYEYKVKAINTYGSSSFSACAGATTQSAGSPPPAPAGLTASALSNSSVYLTWNSSTGAASYDVYTCSGSFVANTTNTNYTVTGLMPNTYYEYKVKAINTYGSSSFSACAGATTQSAGSPPPAPAGLTASALSSSSIYLTWNTSTGAASYDVYTCSGSFVASTTNTNYTVTGLMPNTYYDYKVKAINTYGSSSFSVCAGTTTSSAGNPPPVPTGLTVTAASASSVYLFWNTSTGAASYDIYTCSGSYVGYTTNTYYTISGLLPSTYYDYKIRAVNAYGNSSLTACSGATTLNAGSPPPVPTGLTAIAASSTSISLSWNTSTGAVSYDIYNCSGSFVANTTGIYYTVNGLSPATYYSYKIRALNAYGTSSFCTCQGISTLQNSTPNISVNPASLIIYQEKKDYPEEMGNIQYFVTGQDLINDKKNTGLAARVIIPQSVTDNWRSNMLKKYNKSNLSVVDWSNFNSPVKNQEQCGSCWAFAAIGLLENKNNQLNLIPNPDFSEQEIVSCVSTNGCGGGWYYQAFNYVKNHDLVSETCFPYVGNNSNCSNQCPNPLQPVRISQFTNPLWNYATLNDLKLALQDGPLCVAMNVPVDFYSYAGGVYDYLSGSYTWGHAVLLVGYNDIEQSFKVKNSWSNSWGPEGGYFRIAYNDVTDVPKFGCYASYANGIYLVNANNTSTGTFTIFNTGNAALTISNITSDKTWLTINTQNAVIAPGGSKQVTATITDWNSIPTVSAVADVTILSNDPDESSKHYSVTAQKSTNAVTPELQVTTEFYQDGELPIVQSDVNINIGVKGDKTVNWSVQNSDPWVVLSQTLGQDDGVIIVTLAQNPTGFKRTTYVTITSPDVLNSPQIVSITQGTNHEPVIGDVNKTMLHLTDTVHFSTIDFSSQFNDADGNPMKYVRILSFPEEGTLRFHNNPVIAYQTIPENEIKNLSYIPGTRWPVQASFIYSSSDGVNFAQHSALVNFTGTNGINDNSNPNDIIVFPDPASIFINVKILGLQKGKTNNISLYTVQGELLTRKLSTGELTQFDISGFTPGVYIIKVESLEGIRISKFIKK